VGDFAFQQKGEVTSAETLEPANRGCFRDRGLKVGQSTALGESSVKAVEADFRAGLKRVRASAERRSSHHPNRIFPYPDTVKGRELAIASRARPFSAW
jgi:hypothetical protein